MCRHCEEKKNVDENGFGATMHTNGDTCERFCLEGLDGSVAYEGGQLENISWTVDKLREAMARLFTRLYENGNLTKDEIENIVRGF
jgi:hypothetical protein